MTEQRFRVGDRVDFNNGWARNTTDPNKTPGTIRRVIITRKYIVNWDDGNDDNEFYWPEELVALEEEA